jgi:AcrR family transcriptional regulator
MNVNHEPAGRVERKREARTSAILDEAMSILEREGLEALTLGRLATALGYVPAALYRYFDSKDALVAALQRRAVREIHDGLRAAMRSLDEPAARASAEVAALARLLAGAQHYLSLPRTHPKAFFLAALLMGDPRPLLSDEESRRTAPLLVALLGDVQEMFRAASSAGALAKGDDVERTLAFWAVLQGALSLEKARRIAPGFPSSADVARVAVTSMLVGWGARPGALKRAEHLALGRRTTKKGDA